MHTGPIRNLAIELSIPENPESARQAYLGWLSQPFLRWRTRWKANGA
jgi:hypothetical protein